MTVKRFRGLGGLRAFNLFFKQFSVNLSDQILDRFLARFLTRFLARVLTRVWGRGKTINTMYSTTRPKEKTF